uniref:Uncharacterized protein n=3 Tax=Triticum urartu TaxID=4572 RepID=A0A8R7PAZ4_TRIUA
FATLWVISAAAAARVVGSRAWDEGSASAVFLQALADGALKASFLVLQALGTVMLCGQFLLYVVAAVSGSGSEFHKRAHGAFNQELIRGGSSPHRSPWNIRFYALHPANFSWFSGAMHDVEKDWFCDCGCGDIWL